MMLLTHLTLFLLTMSLIPQINISYELQDTIHTLREENGYLQHKLKNLTQALRDMRKLMLDHSHESAVDGDSDQLHAWNEWIKNGINTETHLMLEQAFCTPDLHNSAVSLTKFFLDFVLSDDMKQMTYKEAIKEELSLAE